MLAIFEREFRSYFKGVLGYVYAAFMLLFAGIYVMAFNLMAGYANFEFVLNSMTFIFLIGAPILTMRIIAEDRHQKTDQLLYSLPLSMTKIVLGKYLALLAVLAVPVLVIGLYPLLLSAFGHIPMGAAYGTLVGFYFLGAALVSMGLFISALTDNQVVAAVVCVIVMLFNYFIADFSSYLGTTALASFIAFTVIVLLLGLVAKMLTKNNYAALFIVVVLEIILLFFYVLNADGLAGSFPAVIGELSLFERFSVFVYGVFDITALVYFVTVVCIFVFLTIQAMEKRRWN